MADWQNGDSPWYWLTIAAFVLGVPMAGTANLIQ